MAARFGGIMQIRQLPKIGEPKLLGNQRKLRLYQEPKYITNVV